MMKSVLRSQRDQMVAEEVALWRETCYHPLIVVIRNLQPCACQKQTPNRLAYLILVIDANNVLSSIPTTQYQIFMSGFVATDRTLGPH